MAETGTLVKLKILAYKDEKFETKAEEGGKQLEFEAMFNPATYSEKYAVEYKQDDNKGASGGAPKFSHIKPREFTFEFMLDGTGVSGKKVDVNEQVNLFLTVAMQYNGEKHSPNYLKLLWGRLVTRTVLKNIDIVHTLLDKKGFPIRSKITATFAEFLEDEYRVRSENAQSPDLTHIRKVTVKSKLPLMVKKEYDNHLYYLSVARVNGLNNFRRLRENTNIKLPPIRQQEA